MRNLNFTKTFVMLAVGLWGGSIMAQGLVCSTPIHAVADGLQFIQGIGKNGPVNANRSNPLKAIGEPQASDVNVGEANVNFVSLGFDNPATPEREGVIILKMSAPFGNRQGADFKVFETSYGSPSCNSWRERVRAFVSKDGCNWIPVLTAAGQEVGCQDTEFELGPTVDWALWIKLEDMSNVADFPGNSSTIDAYDVDGITAYCASTVDLNEGLSPQTATAQSGMQGTTKGGGMIHPNRSILNNANFTANSGTDANGVINFYSLGFDNPNTSEQEGWVILKFNYDVFDQPGADLQVYETTWGDNINNPIPCNNYPERALFYGSLDGTNWIPLPSVDENYPANGFAENELCRDGKLDISVMPQGRLRYVKVIDNSVRASNRFNNGADGYDVDFILALTPPCFDELDGRLAFIDNTNTPDEEVYVGIYPNPVTDVLNINFETSSIDDNYRVSIIDMTGRTLAMERFSAGANTVVVRTIDMAGIPAGIYMMIMESEHSSRQVVKLLKQ